MTDPWPKFFSTPGEAVRWADAFLLSEARLSADNKRASRFSYVDFCDQAQTISVALSAVRNPPGMVFRYLWGRREDVSALADILIRSTWSAFRNDMGAPKNRARLHVLVMLVLQDCRRRCHQSRMTDTEYAKRMHYRSRRQFLRHWERERRYLRETLGQWASEAERALNLDLERWGMYG